MAQFLRFFIFFSYLITTIQLSLAQNEKSYVITKNPAKIPQEDIIKQFDLNQIDWDFFRQNLKRTEIGLDIGVTLEVLSVKELSDKGIKVDESKINKIQFSRKDEPDIFNSRIILTADPTGKVKIKDSDVIVLKSQDP